MSSLKEVFLGREVLSMSKKKRIIWVAGIVLMLACLVSFELYLDRTMEAQTDSDVSSELILARLLAEEGRIITPNWYYSTEIRVFNTNLVFAPLFRVFDNWHTVRLCGTILLHLFLLLSAYFLCRTARITEMFPIVGLSLIMPFSHDYFFVVLRFPYYIPHLMVTLLVFSLISVFAESRGHRAKGILLLILGSALAFFAGLGGPRQIAVCFLPLFFAVLLPVLQRKVRLIDNGLEERWGRYLLAAGVCLAAGLIGFFLNTSVLRNEYHFRFWDISFTSFDTNRMFTAIYGFLQSFGYISGKLEGRVLLHNATAGLLFLFSVFNGLRGIKTGRKKSSVFFFFSAFYISSIVIFVALYSFTDMSYVAWYNLPIVFLAAPVIAMGLKFLDYHRRFRAAVLALWTVLIASCGWEYLAHRGIAEKKTDRQIIAEYLVDNEYYAGYATFWNANILTELSNGAIEVYDFTDSSKKAEGDVNRTNKWLHPVSRDTERPKGKVFLLFSNSQIAPNMDAGQAAKNKLWTLRNEKLILTQGSYKVYGYDSYEDLITEIYDYNFVFADNSWLSRGEDRQGIRYLNEDGVSYGPYIPFREGRYRVTVRGKGLLQADYVCTYDRGKQQIDIEMISQSDQEVVYEFIVKAPVNNGEVLVKNRVADRIEIQSQTIDYLSTAYD